MAGWRAEMAVPVGAASRISTARHISRRIFLQWGLSLDDSIVDDAIVILSELLNDAHRHARNGWDIAHVVLSLDADVLAVAVRDRNAPRASPSAHSEEPGGVELWLVHGLAADANGRTTVRLDRDGGQTIRVELSLINDPEI